MFAIAVLFFTLLYLLLSALVIWTAVKVARRLGVNTWTFGVPVALIMYLIVFWDHIPTLVMHSYYCETEAGFWVYKTPEEWGRENPAELEKLMPWAASRIYGTDKVEFELNGGMVRQYNDRFGLWSFSAKSKASILQIGQRESGIVDVETGDYIVYQRDFISGPRNPDTVWKAWLKNDSCSENRARENGKIFRKIINELKIRE